MCGERENIFVCLGVRCLDGCLAPGDHLSLARAQFLAVPSRQELVGPNISAHRYFSHNWPAGSVLKTLFIPRGPLSIPDSDAGIRTRVAATAARHATDELHTSLDELHTYLVVV